MKKICDFLPPGVRTVAIVGHEHPDGDCAGAVLGLWHYLTENYPALQVTPYLEPVTKDIAFLEADISVSEDDGAGKDYDLAIAVDCAEKARIGAGKAAFSEAGHTACIDHHASNVSEFADVNHVVPEAPAACEILCDLFDMEKVSCKTAICLYTGIAHDTGVFRYEAVTGHTLRKTAELMDKGIPFSKIIRESITEAPYDEKKAAAVILSGSTLLRKERFMYAMASLDLQESCHIHDRQLGAVVSYLNEVREAEVVLFLYQKANGVWKGSLRTKSVVDATKIACAFGGGGHVRAAGFDYDGDPNEAVEKVREMVKKLLRESDG